MKTKNSSMYDVVENSVEGSDWDVWCSWLQLSTETIIWQRAATTTTAMIVGGKILIWISFQPFFIFPPKILIRISFPPFFIFSAHLKTICQLSRPVAWFRMSGGAIHLLKSKWTWNSWFFLGCFLPNKDSQWSSLIWFKPYFPKSGPYLLKNKSGHYRYYLKDTYNKALTFLGF